MGREIAHRFVYSGRLIIKDENFACKGTFEWNQLRKCNIFDTLFCLIQYPIGLIFNVYCVVVFESSKPESYFATRTGAKYVTLTYNIIFATHICPHER